MPLSITKHSDIFSTSPQISIDEVAEIASLGFKTIINNRPDGEGGLSQPISKDLQQAAEKLGVTYLYLPVVSNNITDKEIAKCSAFLANAPTPILGFCRTGNRARTLYQNALNTSEVTQSGWKSMVCNFFQNRCLVTKLVRKFSKRIN